MDIKEKISDIVEQIKKNPNLKEDFEKEPVKVIEKLIGVDLPDASSFICATERFNNVAI